MPEGEAEGEWTSMRLTMALARSCVLRVREAKSSGRFRAAYPKRPTGVPVLDDDEDDVSNAYRMAWDADVDVDVDDALLLDDVQVEEAARAHVRGRAMDVAAAMHSSLPTDADDDVIAAMLMSVGPRRRCRCPGEREREREREAHRVAS